MRTLRGKAVLSRSQNYCKYIDRTDVPILQFSQLMAERSQFNEEEILAFMKIYQLGKKMKF
jgi:hypothetical protein